MLLVVRYRSLRHFEQVHGKVFVFVLQQLEKILEGKKNEGLDKNRVQH